MKSLTEIKLEVDRIAKIIGATESILPTYGVTMDFGRPHIEVDSYFYHYVIVERGQELGRYSTKNLEELLFSIFSGVTFNLAFKYELNNRIEDKDCRRIAFPKQIQLMSLISQEMAKRIESEILEILKKSPYDDEPTKTVNRMRHGNAT